MIRDPSDLGVSEEALNFTGTRIHRYFCPSTLCSDLRSWIMNAYPDHIKGTHLKSCCLMSIAKKALELLSYLTDALISL